ncbi:MAG: Cellobiose phosphorylase [Verrucomicrobia bacterium]|nr:Cellobiose phosphorylase [Verrucomicrobiota bacterium]
MTTQASQSFSTDDSDHDTFQSGELFGPEQLERQAFVLARAHQAVTAGASNRLLERLHQNEQILRSYNRATHAADQVRRVTHAAEWMLDNFYLIEEQIQIARRHLPQGYSRELPRLGEGRAAGLPRVYDLVRTLISHSDAQIDAEALHLFIRAYQTVTPLRLGELWAVPIMLRLALIETLSDVASRLALARKDRDAADAWVNRLEKNAGGQASDLVVVAADMARGNLPLSSSFVTEFFQRLSRQVAGVQVVRTWLEQRLAENGLTIEQLLRQESQSQAADQITVSHSIASLRFLGATDWRTFVETESLVEEILREDAAGVYASMDFATRDRYRHAVESMARYGQLGEIEVARAAVAEAAQAAAALGRDGRTAHVGYYLVDKGQPRIETAAQVRWPWRQRLERTVNRYPLAFYVGGIAVFSCAILAVFLRQAVLLGLGGNYFWWLVPILLLGASQLAVAVLNWISHLVVGPHPLPRLDFSKGIPAESRTMVVVPTMLTQRAAVDRLLESVEIHYLSNRDAHLHFALLTDFADARTQVAAGDEELLRQVETGIELLNRRYQSDRPNIFFLFHRPRRWNEAEERWMGYERKRGKLGEFNALLRGGASGRFSAIIGDTAILPLIRFVITLDTDTQLPRESAHQLVGAIAHPLNRAQFDPEKGVVTEGYSILQPRVGVSLPSAGRSWFVRLFAGEVGIDPYTRAVSDVYQDVFHEGSFIGKGIYDVDAFERAVAGRFPENTVLSHDLIESAHARSALISDVEFYEEFPSRYNTDMNRRHRWIRGDWQIAQWLLPRVANAERQRTANPLSGLSRWKIFDNLRRSLVPAALLLLLAGDWLWAPVFGGAGFLLVLAIVLTPGLLAAATDLVQRPEELPRAMHLAKVVRALARQLGQVLLTITFLPYDAVVSLDAVGRALLRQLFTRKRLLEWQTSSDAEQNAEDSLGSFYSTMWTAPFVAIACGALLTFRPDPAFWAALPVLGLWSAAPWVAWRISQPIEPERPALARAQVAFLRRTARQTWRFFETFVTAEENWLPPDNFQEEPAPLIAPRTSPTNMGLALLANLTALDFGYLSVAGLIARTEDAFATMRKLDRHRGHFYNWYDTRTLRPLPPLYVSSVDSGNLAGHLLTLAPGFLELAAQPICPTQAFAGLGDTLAILQKMAAGPKVDALRAAVEAAPSSLRAMMGVLDRVAADAAALAEARPSGAADEVTSWLRRLERDARDHRDDLRRLAPWLEWAEAPASLRNLPEIDGLRAALDGNPTLREVAELTQARCPELELIRERLAPGGDAAADLWLAQALTRLREASDRASERIRRLEELAHAANEFAAMDFTFLFDPERNLFSIGYNLDERRRDQSYYDLLASEARLCSFVAIAQGQVPQEHWFSLSRLLVTLSGTPVLVSWSGSMFEYLMPLLVMPTYEHTLLDHTHRSAVDHQIEYGRMRQVPWGISESGYNLTDAHLNYQYRAFGVPGLGLKRGLASDLVIAPYASMLAVMVAPREACENLERLAEEERIGAYGFYEAIDYTPSRLPPGQTSVTIRSFMAHHQAMGLLAFAYALFDRPMQRRFLACPIFRATDLLLQERMPNIVARVLSDDLELDRSRKLGSQRGADTSMRIFPNPGGLPAPEVHFLSNGRYHVVVTAAGGGYSRWNDLAVTRWREDATRDCWGTFLYLRDTETGEFFSAAHQPTLRATKRSEAIFTQARAEFRRQVAGLDVHTLVSVSPEDDVELRRIRLTNRGHGPRSIELTSYAEIVLATAAADAAHPAFSNLFVQTEFLQPNPAILATRRARSDGEKPPWLVNLMIGQGGEQGEVSCETDRMRFVGRGGNLARPAALNANGPLSNSAGSVLDPVAALRRVVTIAPGESARIDLVMGVTATREAALALVDKYQNPRLADRAFDLAWTHSQVIMRHLNITEAEAQRFAQLASALIYANPARRAAPSVLRQNRRGQSGLWSHGISGDSPIVLLRLGDGAKIELARQLVQAHAYWRLRGLVAELVILNEDDSGYRQPLQDQVVGMIASGIEGQLLDKPGGIFVRRADQFSPEDRVLLQTVARVVLIDENGTLEEQLERPVTPDPPVPALVPTRAAVTDAPALPPRELVYHNGLGGFTPDGREYVITLALGQTTPAPWVNVIANPYFGTVVSETGAAYTWVENSHEFRLTPWNNDPVTDATGEMFYLRDEQSGQVWSPTPGPARGVTPYVIRHGFGYTVFEHAENGIVSELWIYVAMDAPVKFAALKLRNVSGGPRRISATGYWEWVLADLRPKSLLHVQTELDPKSGALLARNPYNGEFAERIAFVDVQDATRSVTGDRREFFGRNGAPDQPAALRRTRLSGRVGAGLDPCAALQVACELAPGQEREVVFRLGVGRSSAEVQTLIQRFRRPGASRSALEGVWQYWKQTTSAVQVETPDPSVNLLANGWLLYQTLSCRLWGRTGFYQSGGAYGFRDQLQDVMALLHAEPTLAREHLLRAASHQFSEGDVQHWWHPPAGRGVRTHFSDDFLWLPYVTCRYVTCVADTGVLDERIHFLEGRPVKPEEEAYYDLPRRADESATLYTHCVRAIERGLKFGEHGLPLIGCGDWNDGMNLVGKDGRGESVWLAFFLCDVLGQFAVIARRRQDPAFADRCLAQREILRANIERHAWDGQWYRRAYFDNGEPLGSAVNAECQIDSLPQSWAVISGAGDPQRSRQAMDAVSKRLVRPESRLIQLFDPPFNWSTLNPGYIKGYIPGVRENGGQYTHGAIWTTMAFALMGEADRAWELFGLLNPIHHGATPEQIATYKVEPYVVAADVYAVAPHTGRGGWTWYTGSAGWMYRLVIETLLGLKREGDRLGFAPRLPAAWPEIKLAYRYHQTTYRIRIFRDEKSGQPARLRLDGQDIAESSIPLVNDQREHGVELRIPRSSSEKTEAVPPGKTPPVSPRPS